MIAAGFGCRKGCRREDIAGALTAALASAGRTLADVDALCAPEFKAQEEALSSIAVQLGKPMVWIAREALHAQAEFAITISEHVQTHTGLPSVAETSALAGAAGAAANAARLLGPRQTFGGASCALAIAWSRA